MNVVEILQLGFSGFSFALVCLSYFLIKEEQEKVVPRRMIRNLIYVFMLMTFVFAVLNLIDVIYSHEC